MILSLGFVVVVVVVASLLLSSVDVKLGLLWKLRGGARWEIILVEEVAFMEGERK